MGCANNLALIKEIIFLKSILKVPIPIMLRYDFKIPAEKQEPGEPDSRLRPWSDGGSGR